MKSGINAAFAMIAILAWAGPAQAEEPVDPAAPPLHAPLSQRPIQPSPVEQDIFLPRQNREHILWTVMRNRADRDGNRFLRRSCESQFEAAPDVGARLLEEADRELRDQAHGTGSRLDLIEAGREHGALGKFGGFLPSAGDEKRSVVDGGFWTVDDDLRLRLDIYHLADRLGARGFLLGSQAAGEEGGAAGPLGAVLRDLPVRFDLDVRVDLQPTPEAMDDGSVVSSCEGRLRFRWIASESAANGGVEGLLRYEWKPRQPAELSLNFVKSF